MQLQKLLKIWPNDQRARAVARNKAMEIARAILLQLQPLVDTPQQIAIAQLQFPLIEVKTQFLLFFSFFTFLPNIFFQLIIFSNKVISVQPSRSIKKKHLFKNSAFQILKIFFNFQNGTFEADLKVIFTVAHSYECIFKGNNEANIFE